MNFGDAKFSQQRDHRATFCKSGLEEIDAHEKRKKKPVRGSEISQSHAQNHKETREHS